MTCQRPGGSQTTQYLLIAAFSSLTAAASLPPTQLDPVGLAGPEYGSGYLLTLIGTGNNLYLGGQSGLLEPRSQDDKLDAWAYTPAHGTVKVGSKPVDLATAVFQPAQVLAMNAAGQAITYSVDNLVEPFFSGDYHFFHRARASLYTPGAGEVQLGLRDPALADHRHSTGAWGINSSGHVLGGTYINAPAQQTAVLWLRTPEGHYLTNIAPALPPEASGEHGSLVLDDANRVLGMTYERGAGYQPDRAISWLYTPASGPRLLPTTADGRNLVYARFAKDSVIAGLTAQPGNQYDGAYITDGTSTPVRIDNAPTLNLQTDEHAEVSFSNSGYPIRLPASMTPRFIIGEAAAASGLNNPSRTAAWAYSPETGTASLGVFDAEHRQGDRHHHTTYFSTDAFVAGTSVRFGQASGFTSWLWSPETGTRIISPAAPIGLEPGRFFYTKPIDANTAGSVIGMADVAWGTLNAPSPDIRYSWLYDPSTGTTADLKYPGAFATVARDIIESGFVFGDYYLDEHYFTGSSFLWRADLGYIDLKTLHPDLASYTSVGFISASEDLSHILLGAYNATTEQGQLFDLVFIPEPSLAAAALFAPALLLRRRR